MFCRAVAVATTAAVAVAVALAIATAVPVARWQWRSSAPLLFVVFEVGRWPARVVGWGDRPLSNR